MQPFEANDVVPDLIKQQTKALRIQQEARLEAMRRAIYNRIMPRVTPQQDRLAQFIKEKLNGTVLTKIYLVNLLSAEIPSTSLNQLSLHSDVNSITLDHQDGKLELNNSAGAISAAYLWNLGHDGDGDTDVAVVDSGVKLDHPAFNSPRHDGPSADFREAAANPRDANDDSGHGTAVAGIIASNGTKYRGIAHGIDKIINAKVSQRTFAKEGDVMKAIEWAVLGNTFNDHYPPNNELAEIVNFSAGWKVVGAPSNTKDYTRIAQFFDAVVDDLLVPITVSAGNKGNTGNKEKQLTVPGDAYNVFVVGNIDDKNTNIRSDDTIRDTSSAGPTRAGRKKPDICAPGTKIITTLTNNNYGQNLVNGGDVITGTSFAAAHVAGSIALLMDYWTFDPLVIRANLIGTSTKPFSDPDGDGWDKAYGWGYLWNYRAYNKRWNYKYSSIAEGQSYYITGTMSPGERATLVWHRHVDYVNSTAPGVVKDLSDLDLYLWDYTNEEISGPPLDCSTSWIDNVEQVEYNGTGDKVVVIEVRGYDVPSTVGDEWFVLQIHSYSKFSTVSSAAPSSQRSL
jgi:subtilisin family serine protease